jgi:peptidoglycan hydrolase CwlO-like protein
VKSLLVFLIILSIPLVSVHAALLEDILPPGLPGLPGLPDPKVEVPETVPVPDPEPEPEIIDTRKIVSRATIDAQKKELAELRIKLSDLSSDKILKEAEISALESKYNIAEKKYKDSKTVYDKNPDESKRVTMVNDETAMNTAKDNLVTAQDELKIIQDSIRDTNNQIIGLSETVTNSKVKFTNDKSKRSPKTIGIVLGGTCITMLKAQIENTKCPSYEFLMALNLDTSDYRSGSFDYDNGFYHRGAPLLKNDHLLYDFNDYNVIIDPSATMSTRIATITIQPNLGIYTLAADMDKVDNKRVLHTDRYIQDCYRATITASTWLSTIDDTLFFMRNGCEGYLGGTVIEIEDPVTVTNIAESSKWKYDEWLSSVKELSKQNLIGKNLTGFNPSVIEDED